MESGERPDAKPLTVYESRLHSSSREWFCQIFRGGSGAFFRDWMCPSEWGSSETRVRERVRTKGRGI